MCMCVHACVYACVHVCMCARVCVNTWLNKGVWLTFWNRSNDSKMFIKTATCSGGRETCDTVTSGVYRSWGGGNEHSGRGLRRRKASHDCHHMTVIT